MNVNNIEDWAKKLIEAHKNPITRLELPGTKLFIPLKTEEEDELVKKSVDALVNSITSSERVERRCARSVARWLPEHRLAEVMKAIGILSNFGFANKSGRFLYPEETLFLLETNRLELQLDNTPVSIQQAYELVLDGYELSFSKYITYRQLALQGFRLSKSQPEEPSLKRRKLDAGNEATSSTSTQESTINPTFKEIFKKLQEKGPKKFTLPSNAGESNVNYKLFLPGTSKNNKPNFNLNIHQNKYLDPRIGASEDGKLTITGYADDEFIGFYEIESIALPDLT